ncbi:MAG TPA: 3-oxoadipate enol-lactonase [Thermohalobaculum sp.]|nr:3-oxoadipate enol-lactonase [Thermohalobaculum sp.]
MREEDVQAIRANGVLTHVLDEGPRDAPTLVFSNSLGTDLRVWEALMPRLPQGLRTIRYDTRGHGLSETPPAPWRIEDAADDLAALLDELGVRGTAVCGLSVGGLIAQSLVGRRPELVSVLILMDTAAKIGSDEIWNPRIHAVETEGIASISDAILERWFSRAFREGEAAGLWRAMLERTPAEGYARLAAAIRDADLTAAAPSIALPVLAIAGAEDGATPPDLVRGTAEMIPNARFELIDGAGHLPCVEAPEATAELIAGFLRETGLVRAAAGTR